MQIGNDYLLFIKDGADWKTLACLRSNGVDMGTTDITSETKCNGGFEESMPGTNNWSMSFEGDALDDDGEVSQVSEDKMFDLWAARTVFEAKISKVAGTYVRYGKVYINLLAENQDVNAAFTFSGTLKGTGVLSKTAPTGG